MTTYPLWEILLYLSLLLSPPDANRITITGPTPTDTHELRITVTGWAVVRDGAASPVALAINGLQTQEAGKPKFTRLDSHVAPLKDHDWTTAPTLTLADFTTIEKTDTGYVFRRSEDGGANTSAYTITYHRPDPADSGSVITVNVIGMVNNPSACRLARGATLLNALTAAGGLNRFAGRNWIKITRSLPDGNKQTFTVDGEKAAKDPDKAPILQEQDVIWVPERCCF